MNKLLRILAISSLLFSSFGAKAVKSYRMYWDDPFVVEWIISDDFNVEIVLTTPEYDGYSLKLTGQNSVIIFPEIHGFASYNDSNLYYFIAGMDLSEYVPDLTYTLSERNGEIVVGNLDDDSVIYLCKNEGGPEDIEEYTPDKEFVINPMCGFDYVDVNSIILKFSVKK